MLTREAGIVYGNAIVEEIECHLPTLIIHNGTPTSLATVGMVEDKELTVGAKEMGLSVGTHGNNAIVALQSPDGTLVPVSRTALGTREEHLGVEPVDEGRVQVELRLGAQKVLQAIHGCKDTQ